MSETKQAIYGFLDDLKIEYRKAQHAPAFTMEDCAEVDKRLNALTVKNIFLTTKNGKNFYLCITHPDARFRTADISKQAGSSRLSFAPEEKLFELLKAHGGSVSPLGLIFDPEAKVKLLVDSVLPDAEILAFHPCDNTETVAMNGRDFFEKFLPAANHEPIFVEIHDFMNDSGENGSPIC